jgi:hypothetical protein
MESKQTSEREAVLIDIYRRVRQATLDVFDEHEIVDPWKIMTLACEAYMISAITLILNNCEKPEEMFDDLCEAAKLEMRTVTNKRERE